MPGPAITLGMPNLNRRGQLEKTLRQLTALNELAKQVIVVDNGSTDGADALVERQFPEVELIRLGRNLGTAARNLVLERAKAPITLMLDNDSYPLPGALRSLFREFEHDRHLGILACRITLPSGQHEAGGLPGVFIGCGAAMRTDLIRRLGGYPEHYGYYVEEYDLSCRVWQAGYRVRWHYDAVVHHAKSPEQRDMGRILYFLTRNNLRLWHRYCPSQRRRAMLRETAQRYARIAQREGAVGGYLRGLAAGMIHIASHRGDRQELTDDQFDALFGGRLMRTRLANAVRGNGQKVSIFGWGKGLEQVVASAREIGTQVTAVIADRALPVKRSAGVPLVGHDQSHRPESTILIGSLSPGVALDLEAQANARWPDSNVVRLVDFN